MLKTLSLSTLAAFAMASIASAQVVAPQAQPTRPNADRPNAEQREQIREQNREQRREQRELERDGKVIINQNGQRVRVEGAADGQVRGDQSERLNGQLADCFLLKNQEEINMAKFALERSQNEKVKAFAQRLIDDHEKYGQSLERFARHAKSNNTPANVREGQTQTTFQRQPAQVQVQPGQPAQVQVQPGIPGQPASPAQPQVLPGNPSDRPLADNPTRPGERIDVRVGYAGTPDSIEETWYQIERKAVQNCEQMTKEMLSKEKGADFDHCFVGTQIAAHTALLAQMKAAEPHVSGEFQQVVREGIQSVQQHKQHAEELQAELAREKHTDRNVDRNTNRNTDRDAQPEQRNQR